MENPENNQTSQTPDDPAAELAPTGPEEQPIEEAGTRNTGSEAPPAQESGIPEDTGTEPPFIRTGNKEKNFPLRRKRGGEVQELRSSFRQ